MMGTRFVASAEASAHPAYKAALVAARSEDTVYTNCFDGGWPYAMHRVLRSSTFNAWEDAGCPASPARPGEGDEIMRSAAAALVRYNSAQPSDIQHGDTMAACLYAGMGVGGIVSVMPARDIVETLWTEASKLL